MRIRRLFHFTKSTLNDFLTIYSRFNNILTIYFLILLKNIRLSLKLKGDLIYLVLILSLLINSLMLIIW